MYYVINADGEGFQYDPESGPVPAGSQVYQVFGDDYMVWVDPANYPSSMAQPAPVAAPAPALAPVPEPQPIAQPQPALAPEPVAPTVESVAPPPAPLSPARYLAMDGDGNSFEFDPNSGDFPVGMEIYQLPAGGGMVPVDPRTFSSYQSTLDRLSDPSLQHGQPGSLEYALSRYAQVPDAYLAKNVEMIRAAAPNVPANFDWTQAVQNMTANQNAQFNGFTDKDFNDGELPAKLFEMLPGGQTAMQNLQQLPEFQQAQAWGAERQKQADEAGDSFLGGALRPFLDTASGLREMAAEGALTPILAFAGPAIMGGLGSLGSSIADTVGSTLGTAGEAAGATAGTTAATTSGGLSSLIDPSRLASSAIRSGLTQLALTGNIDPASLLVSGVSGGLQLPSDMTAGIDPGILAAGKSAVGQLISTGDIDPTRLITSAALGTIDPKIAEALKGIVPSEAMPAVITLANQALTGQDFNLAAAGANALGSAITPTVNQSVKDILNSGGYQYRAEDTTYPSVFDETDAGMAEALVNPDITPEMFTPQPTQEQSSFTSTVVPDEQPDNYAWTGPDWSQQVTIPEGYYYNEEAGRALPVGYTYNTATGNVEPVSEFPQEQADFPIYQPSDTYQNTFDTGQMNQSLGMPTGGILEGLQPQVTETVPEQTVSSGALSTWEPELPPGTNVTIDESGSYVVTDQDGNLVSTTESQPDRYETVQQDNGTKTVVDTYTGEVVDRIGYTDMTDPSTKTWAQVNEEQDKSMLGNDPLQLYKDLGLIGDEATDLSSLDTTKAYLPSGGVIDASDLPAYTTNFGTGTTSKPSKPPTTPSAAGPLQSISEQFNVKQDNKFEDPSKRGYLSPQMLSTGQAGQVMPLWQGFVDQIQKRGYAIGGMVDHPVEHVPGPEDRMYARHHAQGFAVGGPGTGQSDDIPTMLSDGEYVIDADTVAALGDGSSKAGAEVLDQFRQEIRKHKRSASVDKIPPKAKNPLSYLKAAQKGSNHG